MNTTIHRAHSHNSHNSQKSEEQVTETTPRAQAAHQLGQLLAIDAVGSLLDAIGDANLRDLVLKVMARCREIAVDEAIAHEMRP
ncbi:MAG: hypothetical protein JWM53_6422 [bacterium]|nr:hypothetical protein [bacterium]